ncbi:MAG: hypothetical protein WC562_08690 [Dehalococcoidia bacterium]
MPVPGGRVFNAFLENKMRSVDGITAYPSAPFNLMTGAAVVLMVAVI